MLRPRIVTRLAQYESKKESCDCSYLARRLAQKRSHFVRRDFFGVFNILAATSCHVTRVYYHDCPVLCTIVCIAAPQRRMFRFFCHWTSIFRCPRAGQCSKTGGAPRARGRRGRGGEAGVKSLTEGGVRVEHDLWEIQERLLQGLRRILPKPVLSSCGDARSMPIAPPPSPAVLPDGSTFRPERPNMYPNG